MKPQEVQARGGGVTVNDNPVSTGALIHFVQDAGIRSSGEPPSLLAQAQAKLGILPVEKEPLVKQPSIFYRRARDKHAGAVERIKPIIFVGLRGETPVPYP
jgi:hypothetical protein